MAVSLNPVACFGKTPRHGDFVRHRVTDSLRDFDEWVGRAVFEGRRARGFDEAYDGATVVRFVFASPRFPTPLAGALYPSRDRSGRRYPFIVAAEAPGLEWAASSPERLAPFFNAAATLACDAALGAVDHYGLVERANAIDQTPLAPEAPALGRRLDGLAEGIWGDAEDARKERIVANLIHVLRGAEDGFRFPLGLRAASDAHVWLALLEHLAEQRTSWFSVYEGRPAIGPPSLLAYTGVPHTNALLHLLMPGSDADGVVELEARRAQPLAPEVAALLAQEPLAVADLLARL